MTQTVKLIGTTYILIVLSRLQLVVCTQMRCPNQINMLMLNYLCSVLLGWKSSNLQGTAKIKSDEKSNLLC